MKAKFLTGVSVLGLSVFLAGNAFATKPGEAINPNGYPSGEHFNLNIKTHDRNNFTCPDPVYDEVTGAQIFGNVIHIPSDGVGMHILMESGSKGPKGAPSASTLEVTDWCSGFGNNDAAVLRIPANAEGYAVYARVLGKPSDEEVIKIYDPGLEYVTDDTNNDLIALGFVQDGAFPNYTDVTFKRPKGKVTAEPITNLFMWTGSVCDFDSADYDSEDPKQYASTQCCLTDPETGLYSECIDPTATLQPDGSSLLSCEGDYTEAFVYCEVFEEPTWVFNIADYVGYFWNIDSNGNNLLKVRFYPTQNVSL
jgi:hypothetical protein